MTEIREWFFIPGMAYPVVASFGRGTSISHECEERRLVPSRRVTLIGECATFWFLVFAFGVK